MDLSAPATSHLFRPGARLGVRFLLASATRLCATTQADMTSSIVFAGLLCRNISGDDRKGAKPRPSDLAGLTPSSAYAVAKRLQMPYETTRRHLRRLVDRGLCIDQGEGLLVPAEVLASRRLQVSRQAAWTATRDLWRDVAALGVHLRPWTESHAETARVEVSRLSIALFIDGLLLATKTLGMDATTAMTFLAINQANTAARAQDLAWAGHRDAPLAPHPDQVRDPVSVSKVAKALGLPHETARRHAQALVRGGLCETGAKRFMVVPSRVLARADLAEGAKRGWEMTTRFLADALDVVNLDPKGPACEPSLGLIGA